MNAIIVHDVRYSISNSIGLLAFYSLTIVLYTS